MEPGKTIGGKGADLTGPAGILSLRTDQGTLASNPPIAGENESAQDKNVSEMTPAELAEAKKGMSKNDLKNLEKNANAKEEINGMDCRQTDAIGFDAIPGKEYKPITVAPENFTIADIAAGNRRLWYQQDPDNEFNQQVNRNERDKG